MSLVTEIKALIITALNLEDLRPEDINEGEPLFGEGLGLDSIDALELGVALQKTYGISLEGSSQEENREHFKSVLTLAALVESKRTR